MSTFMQFSEFDRRCIIFISPRRGVIFGFLCLLRCLQPSMCVINFRLRVGERAFSLAAPRLWNALPTDIKRAATLLTFYFIIAFL